MITIHGDTYKTEKPSAAIEYMKPKLLSSQVNINVWKQQVLVMAEKIEESAVMASTAEKVGSDLQAEL